MQEKSETKTIAAPRIPFSSSGRGAKDPDGAVEPVIEDSDAGVEAAARLQLRSSVPSHESSPIGAGLLERKLQRKAASALRKLEVGDDHVDQESSPGHLEWATKYVDEVLDGVITCVMNDMQALPSHSTLEGQALESVKIAGGSSGAHSNRAAYNLLAHSPSMGKL